MMLKTRTTLPQTRDSFQNLIDRVFHNSIANLYSGDEANRSTPLTNISETDTAYELAFELPGVEEQDIDVQLHEQTLSVTAERKDTRAEQADEENKRRWHRVEHRFGSYSRAITLPQDAAHEGIEAVYKNGVLTVTVPKQPEAQPARIEVRGA